MEKRADKGSLPVLVYDGECGFCKIWVGYWKKLTGKKISYAPLQEVASEFSEIPREHFQKSIHLITPKGVVYKGAHAVFRALYMGGAGKWLLFMYLKFPGFAFAAEGFYSLIAGNRSFSLLLTRLFWGKELIPASYAMAQWLFFKALGAVYVIAFLSLFFQISGLMGSNGILPAANFLPTLLENLGPKAFWLFPTVAWLNVSDFFLHILTLGGIILSLLVIAGKASPRILAFLWFLYLSLFVVGQVFLSFQWDILLLEVGFLAIFLPFAPRMIWLFRLLLFKLIFLSGAVKLLSQDITWKNLTALNFHYQTQPLPTPLAWYMHQLPEWFQRFSVGFTFFVELGIVFLIFAPRRLRLFGAFFLFTLQILILLTGNYTFFNLLTLVLILFLLDDAFLNRFFPQRLRDRIFHALSSVKRQVSARPVVTLLAVFLVFLTVLNMSFVFFGALPKPLQGIVNFTRPFHISNTYGLFAVMTTTRPEIIIEGSNDQENWMEYEFKYKPGDLNQPPRFVAPHQPRLDWQMWFAALHAKRALEMGVEQGKYNLWFVNFAVRLLQGSPEVLKLLAKNPFPKDPPTHVRALLYEYEFTDFRERKKTGNWWKRKLKEVYLPSISLADFR